MLDNTLDVRRKKISPQQEKYSHSHSNFNVKNDERLTNLKELNVKATNTISCDFF
jgi:hypothetical protein